MLNDYHIHALSHGEYRHTIEWLSLFLDKARQLHLSEIGFSEHDEFRHLIDHTSINELRELYPEIKIKTGLEVDYQPERENEIRQIKTSYDWDYLIGSVHSIKGWGFDHPDNKKGFADNDIDEIYYNYFNLIKKAAESNYFNIIGHLDLVKIWGLRPIKKTALHYAALALPTIKEAGMAVEINTSGLRKPVGEIYPAPEILGKMHSLKIPVTLGSDAHHPREVGMNFQEALLMAKRAGYQEIVVFENKRALTVKI